MRLSSIFSAALFAVAQATPIANSNVERAAKSPAFFLAGDSTTAVGSGWGDGFLTTLANGSVGKNLAKSGATTASFVSDGVWANVLAAVKASESTYTPYVTIQVCQYGLYFFFTFNLTMSSSATTTRSQLALINSRSTCLSWSQTSSVLGEHRFLSPPLHAETGTIRPTPFSTPSSLKWMLLEKLLRQITSDGLI